MATMTNAEKTLLRYQYTMEATAAAQGDFARTSDSWANSLRALTQSFQALGAIVGEVLINAFKPFIRALNSVMQSVINFARTIANALGNIFGWTYEISGGGMTDDFAGAATGAEEIEDSLGGAADNAKKMKDYVLGIDELNILKPDEPDEGSGGGSGGGAGGGGAGDDGKGEWIKGEGLLEKYKSDIDSLFQLGEYIGKVLTDALNSIDWEKVYEGARNFGKGLAKFLNGLISPELFGALGRTIAGALNTALHFLNAFGYEFDWKDFGNSIAAGVNEFFRTFDFGLLADTINVWANGILDTLLTAIDRIKWREIGERIGDFLVKLDFTKIGKKIGKLIWEAIQAGLDVWNGMFDVAPVETTILTAFGAMKLIGIAQPIIRELSNITDAFRLSAQAMSGHQAATVTLAATYPRLAQALSNASAIFSTFRNTLAVTNDVSVSLSAAMTTFRNSLSGVQKGVIGVVAGFAEFNFVKDNIEQIILGTDNLVGSIAQIGVAVAAAGVAFTTVFGFPAGLIATAVVGVVGALMGINSALDTIKENAAMDAVAESLQNPGGVPLSEITASYQGMIETISQSFDSINAKSAELETTKQNVKDTASAIDLIAFGLENGSEVAQEKVPELQELFGNLLVESKSIFDQEYDVIMTGISGSLQQSLIDAGYSIEQIVGLMDNLKTNHQKAIDEIAAKNEELRQSYEQGTITQQEYSAGLLNNYEQLSQITGETDKYSESINKVTEAASGVDLSQFINEDNTFNTAKLADEFDRLGNTADEAKESIYSSSENLTTALNDYATEAQRIGDSEAANAISDMLNAEAQNVDGAVAQVDEAITKYGDQIQYGLLEKIPSVVDEAVASYGEQGWFYRATTSEAEHVQAALDEYMSSVINPASEGLKSQYEQLGIDGELYASDAAKQIIDGLFETTTYYYPEGGSLTSTTLRSNYKAIFDNAFAGLGEELFGEAQEIGENVPKGFAAGFDMESSGMSKNVTDTFTELAKIPAPILEINSPSKLFERYGRYVVQGFNNGIMSEDSIETMNAWMESIKGFFSIEKWAEVFGNIGLAFQQKWAELVEWWNGTAIVGWWENSVMPWFSAEKWNELLLGVFVGFQTIFTEIFNFVSTIWMNLSTTTQTWWNNIKTFLLTTFTTLKTNVTTIWTYFKTFISTKWTEIYTKTSQIWNNATKFLSETFTKISKNIVEKWTEFRDTIFEKWDEIWEKTDKIWTEAKDFLFETIGNIKDELFDKLETIQSDWDEAMNFLLDTVRNIFDGIREKVSEVIDWALEKIGSLASAISELLSNLGSIGSGISSAFSGLAGKISIPGFATGGFPERGELFMARENGLTEMVGSIGTRSAVANNDQIVAGISSGVRSAVADVVVPYLESLRNSNDIIAAKDMSVNIGDREIAQANLRGQNSLGYRLRTV